MSSADAIAIANEEFYDQEMERAFSPIYRALFKVLGLERAENVNILDLGCWAGGASVSLSRTMRSSSNLAAIDPSPRLVNLASKKLPAKTTVMKAEMTSLPFGDSEMDFVFSNLGLQVCSNVDQVLHEVLRVLKPGGRAAFSVFGKEENNHHISFIVPAYKKVGVRNDPDALRYSFHLSDTVKLRAQFEEVGFVDIKTSVHHTHSPLTDGANGAPGIIGLVKNTKVFASLTDAQRAAFVDSVTADALRVMEKGLTLSMECIILVATKPDY